MFIFECDRYPAGGSGGLIISKETNMRRYCQSLLNLSVVSLLLLIASVATAQQMPVSGTVLNEVGEPLPGATVTSLRTGTSKIADLQGVFSFTSLDVTDSLRVSRVGYQTQLVVVGVQGNLVIQLQLAGYNLNEVVVVGYGTRKKAQLTGAVSQINSKEIQTTTHVSLAQSLQGKVPGLQIRQNTGEPGNFDNSINIRGFGAPLYVIDGIPQNDNGQSFQRIDPNDIESISIIKDASAAIYGLRAANGVLIVTTKKGKKGKTSVSYNAVVGMQKPTDMPKMANRAQWAILRNEADINASGIPFFTREQLQEHMTAPSTDWYGLTMKDAATQTQHNLSIRGGNDAASYFVSLGYVTESGLLRSNDLNYKKYTFRTNLDMQLHKNWKGEISLAGRFDRKDMPSAGFYNIFNGTRTALPYAEPYANGNPEYLALQQYINPLSSSRSDVSGYSEDKGKEFISYATLTFEAPFLKGLVLKGRAAYNNNNNQNKTLIKGYRLYTYDPALSDPYIAHVQNSPSKISNGLMDIEAVTLQTHALYDTRIKDHTIGATMVYEQSTYFSRYTSAAREYDFYTNDQIDQAGLNNQVTNGIEENRASQSLIGRLAYNYRNKYFLEYAFRYDGSYRYHPDRRWGFFPVIQGAWRVSEEKFMRNLGPLSNMKLRASYGEVGQDAGAPFQYVQGFSTSGGGGYEFVDGTWLVGASSPAIVNEKLTWFTSTILNLGIDLGFFNNKLNLEFDVYQRDRSGLLARRLVSLSQYVWWYAS
ncbi:MAG: SusC/RagA family TonB-linked outer membrane protein [Chitinophagaceae bacterium]|nr:SusC/RagA family TonB-linked outer membrane protein [Chitinophagaceae bacterium]